MLEDGVGNLYIAFEKLKEKLSKEGLFDPKYKKKIPEFPNKIGIITASTGAAIKDILTTIKRKKIHRDQYSSDNAVCYLFCQPFYVVMLFFPLVTTYLRIKSLQIHFLSGTSIPNLEEFSSPC